VEAHLERCAECQAELADLRALKTLLAGAAPPKAPPGLWEAVHAGLREHTGSRRRPARRWLVWAWGRAPVMAAGLAVLLLVAIVPIQYLEQSPTRSGVTIDELIARHAGYCARQPLLEHGRLHYLVAEAGVDEAE
jgi:anti-sigma factor RsiW